MSVVVVLLGIFQVPPPVHGLDHTTTTTGGETRKKRQPRRLQTQGGYEQAFQLPKWGGGTRANNDQPKEYDYQPRFETLQDYYNVDVRSDRADHGFREQSPTDPTANTNYKYRHGKMVQTQTRSHEVSGPFYYSSARATVPLPYDSSCKSSSKSKSSKSKSSKSKSKSKSKGKSKGKGASCQDSNMLASDSTDMNDNAALPPPQEIACNTTIVEYNSSVMATFNGQPERLTGNEMRVLEDAFQGVYNEMTYANCDKYFRTIQAVTLTVPNTNRPRRGLQQQGDDDRREDDSLPAAFNAKVGTTDYPITESSTFLLFDDASRRRELLWNIPHAGNDRVGANTAKGSRHTRRNQELSPASSSSSDMGLCLCPIPPDQISGPLQQDDLEPNAPTIDEFLRSFNLEIERLVDEGIIVNIDSIGALEEQQQESGEMASDDSPTEIAEDATSPPTEDGTDMFFLLPETEPLANASDVGEVVPSVTRRPIPGRTGQHQKEKQPPTRKNKPSASAVAGAGILILLLAGGYGFVLIWSIFTKHKAIQMAENDIRSLTKNPYDCYLK